MALMRVTPQHKRVLVIATVIAGLVSLWFLKHYLMLIVLSALIAYLFNPVYQWLVAKGRNRGQAALLTFLASLLAIIIPVILVGLITVFQIERLADSLASGSYSVDATKIGDSLINSINGFLENAGVSYTLTTEEVANAISTAAQSFGQAIISGLLSSITGIFAFITTAIIYIYVFMSMLRHQDKIIETARLLNPLGNQASDLYLERIGAMTKATVRGQFIIAFMQGLESAIVLSLVGLSDLFFFFLMLLTVLSVIPLGAGIVTIPLGIIMILTGNIWQGVVVIANHLLVVTNIDNIMRPRLVPDKARLDPALMILAVFSGLAYFGFIGIVIGPVIMIVLLTTMQMFLEVHRNTESIRRGGARSSGGYIKKITGMVRR
jgi:predicted PurR-regulated permease PerM